MLASHQCNVGSCARRNLSSAGIVCTEQGLCSSSVLLLIEGALHRSVTATLLSSHPSCYSYYTIGEQGGQAQTLSTQGRFDGRKRANGLDRRAGQGCYARGVLQTARPGGKMIACVLKEEAL